MSRFYITTAIDYANGEPHIGHAYERIGADAIARYRRLRGDDVHFLIGMDEHGQKVAQAAEAEGITPQAFVDRIAASFRSLWDKLDISYDQFMRTSDPAHKAGVQALVELIYRTSPDDFYEKEYEGLYCVGCEQFKREAEIVDGRCPVHPTRVLETKIERNWFFRLSRHQDYLLQLLAETPRFLQPESRRNEILALIRSGLEDISVTRGRLAWGIPWPRPLSTGEEQVAWVWFDALPNYLTGTGFPDGPWRQRWPAQLHVVGKDITRLHCVIWPAMLRSAGLPLPERVWGHGFVLFKGERFSKSAGNVFSVAEAVERYGSDAFRYFMLREVPWDSDGVFTWERFDERYTADLADAFGNLASRVLAMLHRYRAGVVPEAPPTSLDHAGDEIVTRYATEMDALLLHRAAQAAWDLVAEANAYVERRAPWAQSKAADHAGLDETLGALARCLARLTVLATPFIPRASLQLWRALGLGDTTAAVPSWNVATQPQVSGLTTSKTPPLFPKQERLTTPV
ncbi:MAG TPA: methionine--tRNA ligase [Gemmatimonadales bacterium]|nr:methionine--tRNA ligase [Gemmatimonadales bacterium]